jgi:hypothetical protein
MGIDKFRRKAAFKGKVDALDDITMKEGKNIVAGTATGSKIGTAVTQKLGFWNKAPVIQPKSADQEDQGAMTATLTGVDTGTDMTAAQAATIVADLTVLDTLLTAIRTALVDAGIMKGSA